MITIVFMRVKSYMKKIHWYYKFLIIFIIFFSMFFLLTKNMSNIINSSSYKNYMNFINVPFNFLNKYNIFNYKNVLNSNEQLSKKVLEITNEKEELKSLREEVRTLKEVMKIDEIYSDYDVTYAKTIGRNKMYWFSTITIDKGKNSNIKEGNVVVTENGLIGTVQSVTKGYSRVKLITNNENSKISVGIKIKDSFKYGTIIDYEYPYLKIELTSEEKGIKKNEELVTSGLGNLPKNIKIGKIEKYEKDSYGVSNILYVRPYQDMNDINYVAVLIK